MDSVADQRSFLHQRDSWSPLAISLEMLQSLMQAHEISLDFLDVVSCFRGRTGNEDQGYSAPIREAHQVDKYGRGSPTIDSNYFLTLQQRSHMAANFPKSEPISRAMILGAYDKWGSISNSMLRPTNQPS